MSSNSSGVSDAVQELENIKMTDIEDGTLDLDELDELRFASTFHALLAVIQEQDSKQRASKERREKQAQSRSRRKTVTTDAVSAKALKHVKTNTQPPDSRKPKTPDQPIPPANPNLSGFSTESKDEENTKFLLNTLLSDTMKIVKSEVRRLHWVRSDCKVEITKTYFPPLLLLTISNKDSTNFFLRFDGVTAINDGGLGIRYNNKVKWTEFQPSSCQPVLSLEVPYAVIRLSNVQAKRKNHKNKDSEELMYEHAGQIFCEMLGQSCYPEFYENSATQYQEVCSIDKLVSQSGVCNPLQS